MFHELSSPLPLFCIRLANGTFSTTSVLTRSCQGRLCGLICPGRSRACFSTKQRPSQREFGSYPSPIPSHPRLGTIYNFEVKALNFNFVLNVMSLPSSLTSGVLRGQKPCAQGKEADHVQSTFARRDADEGWARGNRRRIRHS